MMDKPKPQEARKHNTIVLIIIGCLFLIVLSAIFREKNPVSGESEAVAVVEKKDFVIRIAENGVLEAVNSITLGSQLPGNRARIIGMVPEGPVTAGTEIIHFDRTPFEEDIRKYTAEVTEAGARLKEAEDNLTMERVKYRKELYTTEQKLKLAQAQEENILKGEGNLKLLEKEMEMDDFKVKLDRKQKLIEKIKTINTEGLLNKDLEQAEDERSEVQGKYNMAKMHFEVYRDYSYPEAKARARAEVSAAELELQQVKDAREIRFETYRSRLKTAEATFKSAHSKLSLAQDQLEKTAVTAPTDGFVIYNEIYFSGEKRKVRIGDAVWVNQPIITLPDISRMYIQTRVREIDIHQIQIGQEVGIYVNAFPDMALKGQVEHIGALAEKAEERRSHEKYFNLKVLLEGSTERLRPGMTARVEILVEDIKNALVIPVNAVFIEEGKATAYVVKGKKIKRREISVGSSDGNILVVKDGLKKGEKVSLYRPGE